MRIKQRRRGITLMEVLIATFILAVGLIAIMALFPLGAVNMARAINQDRSATHGVNSDSVIRYEWKLAWQERELPFLGSAPYGTAPVNYAPIYGNPTGSICPSNEAAYRNSQEPMLLLMDAHPYYGQTIGTQASFPVLVDPIGWNTKAGNLTEQGFIAGNYLLPVRTTLRRCIRAQYTPVDNQPVPSIPVGFPRITPHPAAFPPTKTFQGNQLYWDYPNYAIGGVIPCPSPFPSDIPASMRLCALLDDMTFAKPGDNSTLSLPGEPADFTGQLERAGRYTVAWLLQRENNADPTTVNVKVLVYAGRSPTSSPSGETAYSAYAVPDSKLIQVALNGQALPSLRVGGWIAYSRITNIPLSSPYPTFDFYRVTGITNPDPDNLFVEVETPIKGSDWPTRYAVVFDNLVEVFDRDKVSPGSIISR